MTAGLRDAVERARIARSLDETLVVEAAAGTGKTTELVGRLINVLAEGRGRVETVAAVAFTDKAAGELKLRLRAGLENARRDASETTRRAHLEDAIGRLEEARIGTIHSFCADMLRERTVEARVDPDFRVITEPEAKALYRRSFQAWIETCYQDPPEGVRRALRRPFLRDGNLERDGGPVERMSDAGWGLAAWRDLRAPWRRPAFDRAERTEALAAALHALADALGACSHARDSLFNDTAAARRLSADIREVEREQSRDLDGLEAQLIDLLRDKRFRRPRRGSDRNYPDAAARAAILRAHESLVRELDAFARDADADLAALLHGELLQAVDGYEALKARQGVLDFTDLLIKTRDALRDRADVRAAMQARLTHIFVDEFQDTDPLQAEIVLLLASDDSSVSDWRQTAPVPGKLFIVGDPKQSIYRFRGADVGTYQEVKSLLCGRGAALLQLTTSFRAVPSIQRLVNRAFGGTMSEDRATLQAGYVPLAPHRRECGRPAVVALPVPRFRNRDGEITKRAISGSLPDAVAAFVRWLLTESGWTVTERDHPEPVPVEARHVCLLFRNFTAWGSDLTQPYVEALEARGIAQLLVGGKSFHLREEVESLRTALAAIEWPDDELSIFATLKGPLVAIGDEELLEWRQRFGRLRLYAPRRVGGEAVPEHLAPIRDALSLLRDLHRRRNRRPVEETIHDLLAATRAHAGFVLRPRGEQVLANVMRVADLARTYETGGGLSFRGFVDRLRSEMDTEAPEAPILEEGSEGVRIMTVHKAKGLEFPVVVLADPTANLGPQHASRYVDRPAGLCALRLSGCAPHDLLEHEDEEVARERAEGVRVAYVAATRARDLLVVPVLGEDPFGGAWPAADESWIAPVQRAVYPAPSMRQKGAAAAGCPPFGTDTVCDRPPGEAPGPRTVRPGCYDVCGDGEACSVVWWDPHTLALDVRPIYGVRREDLIRETNEETVAAGRRAYEDWRRERDEVRARAARPSLTVETVGERARRAGPAAADAAPVDVVDAAAAVSKPGGRRFGALVHAILAVVPLDGGPAQLAESAEVQARILGAPTDELEAAKRIAQDVLSHPLLRRARDASQSGRCRREMPITWVESDGVLVEGVLDLAFEDQDGWTVLDFKTDRELGAAEEQYRRQVRIYAAALERATGKPAKGVILRL